MVVSRQLESRVYAVATIRLAHNSVSDSSTMANNELPSFVGRALVHIQFSGEIGNDEIFHNVLCVKRSRNEKDDDNIDAGRFVDRLCTLRPYLLFTTFYAANFIQPTFKLRNIHFRVSIGPYGNPVYEKYPACTNKTLSDCRFIENIIINRRTGSCKDRRIPFLWSGGFVQDGVFEDGIEFKGWAYPNRIT
ncbi:unnamed protein product [Toxocara canis]|uniref:Uncharacterized protein n=1 Tax=Toxocara canis TaxID=6265 RepID=A0A183U103_TOXCA|nr:unnamed protein product [Toxocara canis]